MPDELLVRNVRPGGGQATDIRAVGGTIAEVGGGLAPAGAGASLVDGAGAVVIPGLVEAHTHLDKTLWGRPWQPHGAGPSLMDRITHERQFLARAGLSTADQAAGLARQAMAMGSTHIRSHVDVVPDIGLANVEALLATRQALEGMVDLQIVAFPQTGVLVAPGTAELLEEAVALGADVVGGIDPGAIDRDPAAHLDTIFAIADRRGAGIDIHLHETDGLGALAIELIAERTRALGLGGRVVISHAFCLATLQAAERDRLIGLLAEHHIAVLTTAPGDRPFPPIKALRRAGVTVCAGSDGIRDCWSPFGNADMLERAMLLAWRSGFRTDADLELALDVVTQGGARALGLADYGLEPGCRADFVLLAGEILAEAVVRRGPERCVVKAGRVVARDGACLV